MYKDKDKIENTNKYIYNEEKKVNVDLILINNIKNDGIYEFNLSSRKPSLIPVLKYKGFDEIKSNTTNVIKYFEN